MVQLQAKTVLRSRTAPRLSVLQNPWVAFIVRRVCGLVLVCLGLIFASFSMVRLVPGDPAATVLGEAATPEAYAQVRAELGIDEPFAKQFASYLGGLARGDLGISFQFLAAKTRVNDLIALRAGTSLQLATASLTLVLVVGIPLGLLLGALTRESRHRNLEVGFTALASVAGGIPEFLMATFLAFVFAIWLRWLPVAGAAGPQSLVLPVLAVSLRPIMTLARIVRVETLNVLATDYVRTARSKRLPARVIFLRHVLPNVATAAITIGGLLFSSIVGGAVVVENIFNRPGLGTTLVTAVNARDFPVIQGMVLVIGVTVVLANAIVDIVLAIVNPRSLTKQA